MKKMLLRAAALVLAFLISSVTSWAEWLVTEEDLACIEKAADVEAAVTIQATAAMLMERRTGKVLFEANADEQVAPASITKIMTLLLVMEALDAGKFKMETEVSASEHACSMGGSQIWLEPGEIMTVHELLKAAAIASANDAAVALAELVSGTEEAFVELMNQRAAELGMANTVFKNATGLDAEGHVSTARDIALMSAELLKHDAIKEYSTVWMDSLRNGETELVNTNRLVRFYKGCTGLKTGSTDEAGCCLAASAMRDGMELISVTLGRPNTDARFAAARKMLDYGFANYAVVEPPDVSDSLTPIPVIRGVADTVQPVCDEPQPILVKKGDEGRLSPQVTLEESLEAPVTQGQKIGSVIITLDGEVVGEYPVLAKNAVARLDFGGAFVTLMTELCRTVLTV